MPILPTLGGLLDSTNMGPLTVHRPGPPTQNAHGGYDSPTDSQLELDPVTVHTLTGDDLEQMTEADRVRGAIRIYAGVRLYGADDGQAADRVEYKGHTWRVVKVEDNELAGGVWMADAVREDGA
jgi:hypothetical protein